MPSRLILLRHGKSDWHSGAYTDFDRPLNQRGARDAPQVGRWMHFHGLKPSLVVCSSATRTRETLRGIAAELNLDQTEIRYSGDLYMATEREVVAVAGAALADANEVMLIGHNPGLELALLHYVPDVEIPADGKLMVTCCVAIIDFPAVGAPVLDSLRRPEKH